VSVGVPSDVEFGVFVTVDVGMWEGVLVGVKEGVGEVLEGSLSPIQ
jgi:hypothetical protein